MPKNLKIVLGALTIISVACSNCLRNPSTAISKLPFKVDTVSRKHVPHIVKYNTFFDSILAKTHLTSQQITWHTITDSLFMNPENYGISKFVGDTIYNVNSSYSVAIINYDGLSCFYSYLLIYRKGSRKNSDSKTVSINCDDDGDDQDYSTLDSKIVNDSIFYTTDTYYKRSTGKEDIITKHSHFYKIGQNGRINILKKA